jgi:hypothetical protein
MTKKHNIFKGESRYKTPSDMERLRNLVDSLDYLGRHRNYNPKILDNYISQMELILKKFRSQGV